MNPDQKAKDEELLKTFGPRAQEFLRRAQRQAEDDRKFIESLFDPKQAKDDAAFQEFLKQCGVS